MIQNKSILIGITGGIGTGKSTASKIIREKAYPVIDADQLAREVVEKGKPAYKEIVDNFGERVLLENGDLNRKALGDIVFNDEKERIKLNKIVHGHIYKKMKTLIEEISKNEDMIFLDIPLLFEEYETLKEYDINFDGIWLIYTNRENQIKRIVKRDNLPEEDAIGRVDSQMDIEKKRDMASEILDNSGTVEELKEQIDRLFK